MLSDSQKWLLFAGVFFGGWLIYLLAPVLMPFMIAALLSYLGDPLVDRLEKTGLSRTFSVTIVFVSLLLMLVLVLLFLVPLLESQLVAAALKVPVYLERLQQEFLPAIAAMLNIEMQQVDAGAIREMIGQHWQQAGGFARNVLAYLSQSSMQLVAFVGNIILIPVVTFYLLRDWDLLVARIAELVPRRYLSTVTLLARQTDEVLGAFLRGQLSVMAVLAFVYSTGLWIVGLDLAIILGMTAGIVSFVPYLGVIVGLAASGVAAYVQFQEIQPLIGVIVVFGVGQLLEGMLLTPWLVGDRIGLHPVAVIFAVLVGGQLFGFVGVLIGLPVAAVIAVMLRYLHERYRASNLYQENDSAAAS